MKSFMRVLLGVSVGLVVLFVVAPMLGLFVLKGTRVCSNEVAARAALRACLAAQNEFRHGSHYSDDDQLRYANPWQGSGFSDLYQVGGPGSGGEVLELIDLTMARATAGGTPRAGYLFCDVVGRAGKGPYDHRIACGLPIPGILQVRFTISSSNAPTQQPPIP